MRPEFDERDAQLLKERETEFNAVSGPRVGDFLRTPDGFLRFTHDWGDSIQTTVHAKHPCHGDASFYFGSDGHVSFSGSLNPAIDKKLLRDTGEKLEGSFWFFHHNWFEANNGVYCRILCRVFENLAPERKPGDPLGPTCQHTQGEDCMNCSVCGLCKETLDDAEVCDQCR